MGHPDFPSILPVSISKATFCAGAVVVGATVVVGAAAVVGAADELVVVELEADDPQADRTAPTAKTARLPASAPGLRYLPEETAI